MPDTGKHQASANVDRHRVAQSLRRAASLVLSGITRRRVLLHLLPSADDILVPGQLPATGRESVEPVSVGDKARLSGPSVCRKPGASTLGVRLPR